MRWAHSGFVRRCGLLVSASLVVDRTSLLFPRQASGMYVCRDMSCRCVRLLLILVYSVFLWLRDFFTTLIIVGGRVEIRVLVAAFGRTLSISSYL